MKKNFWIMTLLVTVLFSGLNVEAKRYRRGHRGYRSGSRFGFGLNIGGSPYYSRYGHYSPYGGHRTVVVKGNSSDDLRDAIDEYKELTAEQKDTIKKLEQRLEDAEKEIKRLGSK